MKKALTLALGLMLGASEASAAAADLYQRSQITGVQGQGTQTDAVVSFVNLLNYTLGLLGLAAVVVIIIAAVQYITSQGDSGKIDSSRKTIIAAGIGLVIVGLAYTFVRWVVDSVLVVAQS